MPAITSTSSRMQGEILRLLFLQAHRETTAHLPVIGMPAQQHCDSFRFRRAAFYNGRCLPGLSRSGGSKPLLSPNGLKSKVGLAAAKTAAMRINLNISSTDVALSLLLSTPPRAPLSSSPTSLLTTSPSPRAAQWCEVARLDRTGRG